MREKGVTSFSFPLVSMLSLWAKREKNVIFACIFSSNLEHIDPSFLPVPKPSSVAHQNPSLLHASSFI
jgi:hypothetical protein